MLGLASSFGLAFYKAEEAAGAALPTEGAVLVSLAEKNAAALEVGRAFAKLGFRIRATDGTHRYFAEHGIASERIHKIHEGRPHIADAITNGELQLIVNTPIGRRGQSDDSYIRKSAIRQKLPYVTTLAAALAAAKGIAAARAGKAGVRSLQAYHAAVR